MVSIAMPREGLEESKLELRYAKDNMICYDETCFVINKRLLARVSRGKPIFRGVERERSTY